jgi:hypothetical protein
MRLHYVLASVFAASVRIAGTATTMPEIRLIGNVGLQLSQP